MGFPMKCIQLVSYVVLVLIIRIICICLTCGIILFHLWVFIMWFSNVFFSSHFSSAHQQIRESNICYKSFSFVTVLLMWRLLDALVLYGRRRYHQSKWYKYYENRFRFCDEEKWEQCVIQSFAWTLAMKWIIQ